MRIRGTIVNPLLDLMTYFSVPCYLQDKLVPKVLNVKKQTQAKLKIINLVIEGSLGNIGRRELFRYIESITFPLTLPNNFCERERASYVGKFQNYL